MSNLLDRDEVIRKIQGMKALIEDPNGNSNEQAIAMAQMQKLRTKYDIQLSEMEYSTSAFDIKVEGVIVANRIMTWKKHLLNYVAQGFDCRAHLSRTGMDVVGAPHDLEIVRYMFESLSRTLEAGAKKAHVQYKRERPHGAHLGAFKNTYIRSAGRVILQRLKEARKEAVRESDCTAVVVSKEVAVNEYINENLRLRNVPTRGASCGGAREAGTAHGQSISLRGGLNGGSNQGAISA
jgi:hypothetical protein